MNWHKEFKYRGQTLNSIAELFERVEDAASLKFFEQWFNLEGQIAQKTSGSTGTPQIISLSKQAMRASAQATGDYFSLGPSSKVLHVLSSDFIAGKMMWVRAFTLGWDVYTHNEQTADDFDFSAMVPLQVYQSTEDQLNRIHKLLIGGGVYNLKDLQRYKGLQTELFASYGMTETVSHIAVMSLYPIKEDCFTSLKGVRIGVDHRDCLWIEAGRINPERIQTNDVVELLDAGHFIWKGRYDFVINSGGVKLQAESIEDRLRKAYDCDLFVAGLPDEKLGQRLVLCLEGKGLSRPSTESDKEFFSDLGLTTYERPKEIYYIEEFIRTETKKIQRLKTLDLI
ncbi:MAG: AMP-binding protein [Flavobacteriaceae bacterium]